MGQEAWAAAIVAVVVAAQTIYTQHSDNRREQRVADAKKAADALAALKLDRVREEAVAAAEKVAATVDKSAVSTVNKLDGLKEQSEIIHKLTNSRLTQAIDARSAAEARTKILLDLLGKLDPNNETLKALVANMSTEAAMPAAIPQIPEGG